MAITVSQGRDSKSGSPIGTTNTAAGRVDNFDANPHARGNGPVFHSRTDLALSLSAQSTGKELFTVNDTFLNREHGHIFVAG